MEAERRCSDPFRGRRTNIAVATAWQCLDPVLATGFFPKDAQQRRDLYAQIAFLDREVRPGSLNQRILRNRHSRPLHQRPKEGGRALPQHNRAVTAKQDLGLRI